MKQHQAYFFEIHAGKYVIWHQLSIFLNVPNRFLVRPPLENILRIFHQFDEFPSLHAFAHPHSLAPNLNLSPLLKTWNQLPFHCLLAGLLSSLAFYCKIGCVYFQRQKRKIFDAIQYLLQLGMRGERREKPYQRDSSSDSSERERSRDEKNRQYWRRDEQPEANLEVIRSLERIRQQRETLIDKFVKILLIYQGKFPYDPKVHEIMAQPKLFLSRISMAQMQELFISYKRFSAQFARGDQSKDAIFSRYWGNLGKLMEHYSHGKHEIKEELKAKIEDILNKPIPQLLKLEVAVDLTLKNPSFGIDLPYWEGIKRTIEAKVAQHELMSVYSQFKLDRTEEQQQIPIKQQDEEPLSPVLAPASSVNPKLFTTYQAEQEERNLLAAKIFKEEFQKCRQKLQDNLSLPKNHNLFSRELVSQSTAAYDFITQQIIEFEKYKRMEEDEEDFDQWIPTETEGRFRDRKPQYINRVRVSCEWNKYNQTHFSEDNPPPKSIQGYKFNIFYPDLCDKQKTPQYYLEQLESPDYCLIKFKAGPPYKDIAFKIQRREWDFSEKSGFESIFAKGILHLYFNFKKPRFRI